MVKLIVVHSILESPDNVKLSVKSETDLLTSISGVEMIGIVGNSNQAEIITKSIDKDTSGLIIFAATGGTEDPVNTIIGNTRLPVLLFAISRKNSLAASLEVYSYLKESRALKLYVSESPEKDIASVSKFISVCKSISHINAARLGLIGEPSDWLLSSRNVSSFGSFKTELIKLTTDELVENVGNVNPETTEKVFDKIKSDYHNRLIDDSAIKNSGKVYSAMKNMVAVHQLDSLTIRCFDLLDYKYTACMGMSMCNDEGIVSGCEGDLPATFTMMIGSSLAGSPCWMANPAVIDKTENTITFAHCTIPSKMLTDHNSSNLTTHMESGMSVANQGKLKDGVVTICRINSEFNKLLVTTGEIINSDMRDSSLCRTQAKIRLNGSIDKWIENSLGNHQVIIYGDITEELIDFCKFTGIELISIN